MMMMMIPMMVNNIGIGWNLILILIGVIVGVVVGWVWKPNWTPQNLNIINLTTKFNSSSSSSSIPTTNPSSSSEGSEKSKAVLIGEDDLDHLWRLIEGKDEGRPWIHMMDRSGPNMFYQAWRRDPPNGPPQYRSRTVYEDATPELLRDFFWDDEFRVKWDDMLLHAETVEECPTTGTMVVRYLRKFPFFCSNREYIIGRRIWKTGRTYYCITKDVPCPSIPKHNKPRRVDSFYSSWIIRAVESSKGNGQMTAAEILLFHQEEMGIPWEIAKIGIRQGMWGAVKNIVSGLRRYQKERESGAYRSHCASMAKINTKINTNYFTSCENKNCDSSEIETTFESPEKPLGRNIPKIAVIGGAIIIACSLDRGLLTKAVIFGVARRFANMGRRW